MTENTPLVSIIVPCYNAEKYLPETLESIFSQTYQNCEVIIVDDGSTDSTSEIIGSLGDRVKAIHENNEGVSAARTKGTNIAKGKYIQYIDADDLIFPDAIGKLVDLLEKTQGEIAYSDYQWLEKADDGEFKPTTIRPKAIEDANPDLELALLNSWWRPMVCLLFRHSFIKDIPWKNENVQDAFFLFDACAAGARFFHCPGVGAYYRVHEEGMSRDKFPWFTSVYRRISYIESHWKEKNTMSEARRRGLISAYEDVVKYGKEHDEHLFQNALDSIFSLHNSGTYYKAMARILGYRTTERVYKLRMRGLRKVIKGIVRGQ